MISRLILTAAISLTAVPVYAQTKVLPALTPVRDFKAGIELSYINYEEESLDVEEKGPFVGVYGSFNFRPDWDFKPISVIHVDGHANYGMVDYSGSGEIDDISNYMMEPRVWVGHDLVMNNTRVTPYAGVGYRFLYDDGGGTQSSTGAFGYDRRSQYLYIPVGVEIATHAVPGWELGLTGEYDFFILGRQKSYLSEFAGFPDLDNKQDEGYGIRGSIDIVKKTDSIDFHISPYIRYWNIEQSDTVTATGSFFQVTGFEPQNESMEIGLRLGAQF